MQRLPPGKKKKKRSEGKKGHKPQVARWLGHDFWMDLDMDMDMDFDFQLDPRTRLLAARHEDATPFNEICLKTWKTFVIPLFLQDTRQKATKVGTASKFLVLKLCIVAIMLVKVIHIYCIEGLAIVFSLIR